MSNNTPTDFAAARETYRHISNNIAKIMRGQGAATRHLLAALAAGGHVLLEDYPGTGKTTLAKQLETVHQALRLCPDEWIKVVIRDETNKVELDRLRDPIEGLQWITAQKVLRLGTSVILENGFWSKEERLAYRNKAKIKNYLKEFFVSVRSQEMKR